MLWLSIGVMVAFFVVRHLWRSYNHPSHVLGRQAANMNWVAIGTAKDAEGYNDLRLSRAGMEAQISFRNRNVRLINPANSIPFKDFIELERWLAKSEHQTIAPAIEEDGENDEEILYYRAVQKYVTDMGFYEPLLVLQGTDEGYCIAVMKMHKAGYLTSQSSKVVGALTLDSVKKYEASRELALLFLEALEKKFSAAES